MYNISSNGFLPIINIYCFLFFFNINIIILFNILFIKNFSHSKLTDTDSINIDEFIFEKFPDLAVDKGKLYIVSTPIGNLKDISFRALFFLKNVDLIAAEDTRVTANLLKHYGIKKKIISYYSQVEKSKIKYLIEFLKEGNSVALVSDAGTPCISDPGNILVSEAIKNSITITSVPGASSLIHSLVISGISTERFYFQGFLPKKKGREKTYKELKNFRTSIIIFESKFRIKKTLLECLKIFGNKNVIICRELTKLYEEILRGKLKEICSNINKIKEKGEFVIIIDNR